MSQIETSSPLGRKPEEYSQEYDSSSLSSTASDSIAAAVSDVRETFRSEAALYPARVSLGAGVEETPVVARLMRPLEALKTPCPLSRLNPAEKARLEALIDSKGDVSQEELTTYCGVLLEADFSDALFEQKDWLVFAFMGYQKGLLSSSQLAAAAHLDLFLHTYPDAKEKIGSLNDPDVRTRVFATFDQLQGKSVTTANFDHLSPLDTLVLFVPVPEDKRYDTVYEAITDDGCILTDQSAHEIFIPSPRALQEMLDSVSPLHSVTVFPAFGYSKKIKDFIHIPHLRVLGVDCRYFPQPDEVHDLPKATPFDMVHHDGAFHAIMTSFDPYREVEDVIGVFFWEQYSTNRGSDDAKSLKEVALAYIDRPFFYTASGMHFHTADHLDDAQCFLYSMILHAANIGPEKFVALMKECFEKNGLEFPITSISAQFLDVLKGDHFELDLAHRLIDEFSIELIPK